MLTTISSAGNQDSDLLDSGSVSSGASLHAFRRIGDYASRSWFGWLAAVLGGALWVGLFGTGAIAHAGLSATDVAVIVNAGSLNSRTLANHFVALRGIPASNVVVLAGVPNSEVITVNDFRDKILRPMLLELERRHLLDHIQCVAYSTDFPSGIDIRGDLKEVKDLHQIFTPVASINSLTYLYAQVLAGDPSYIGLHANFYARREMANYFTNPGGSKTQTDWEQIQAQISADQHAQASNALEKLLQEHPSQFPLAYMASAQAALAGEKPRAIKLLRTAISLGWNSSRYLKNDPQFDSLRQDPDFQVIEYLLDDSIKEMQPPSGFDARQAWTPNGVAVRPPEIGNRYLLSIVLGITRGAGTSLAEAIAALQRSSTADFTHPQGGFYFSLTEDVRTTTRQWGAMGAVDDLQLLGFEAEIIKDRLPMGKKNVLGAQFGTPRFDWNSSQSQLLPGAVADNLTSLGGVMTGVGGQTNLSELIKAGAAGSSGTVAEPYALQEKFPHPQMYVAYARGASLIEAFYLYVTGPYQLLIVGDPLCQPFSPAPRPQLDSQLRLLAPDQSLQFDLPATGIPYSDWLELTSPMARRTEPLAAARLRVLLDGIAPQTGTMQPKLKISLEGIPAGYHEVVLQFIADGPLASCSSSSIPIWIGPPEAVLLSVVGTEPATVATPKVSLRQGNVNLQVTAQAAEKVSLWHDSEQLAEASGKSHEFTVRLDSLGMGPIRLLARAELPDGSVIKSLPLQLEVVP